MTFLHQKTLRVNSFINEQVYISQKQNQYEFSILTFDIPFVICDRSIIKNFGRILFTTKETF